MKERILVVGSGAREHALAYKLSCDSNGQSASGREVIVLGGNAGIAKEFETVQVGREGILGVVEAAQRISPSMVVIGPEALLAQGVVDALLLHGICAFGPSKKAARLEASKSFMKSVCEQSAITTAEFREFNDLKTAIEFIKADKKDQAVIKVDGLCGGKGVKVCRSKDQSIDQLKWLFELGGFARLGCSDQRIVIEEFLPGAEVSVFGIANGQDVVLFNPMQDYKRLGDNDAGPNTGGMGSVGPVGENNSERDSFLLSVKEKIFLPSLRHMRDQGASFSGLLYAGLMLTEDGPKLLEFNVRFGDPETQPLLFGSKADIYPLMLAIAHNEVVDLDYWQQQLLDMKASVAVVMASGTYPTSSNEPTALSLPAQLPPDTKLFFAATSDDVMGNFCAGSGRVLSAVGRADSIEEARSLVYELIKKISFMGMQYRLDIGTNLSRLQQSSQP